MLGVFAVKSGFLILTPNCPSLGVRKMNLTEVWTAMGSKVETVILIHGLWMPALVMLPHQRWLHAQGFAVRRFAWPSWRDGMAGNVRLLSRFITGTPGDIIHLVAHSLGGLLSLQMLAQPCDPRIGRIVLMGTPYGGCHSGFAIAAIPGFSWVVGRSFEDWFSQPPPELPSTVCIGVIAGTRRVSFGRLIPGLPRPNDGLISVDETRLRSAMDSIALDVCHSGMLASRVCAAQVACFLKNGAFVHA